VPEVSPLSRGVALALSVTLGVFGAHRFYAGKTGTGLLMLATLGGMGLWYLYDLILVAAGEFRDADGRLIYAWSQFDRQQGAGLPGAVRGRQAEELQEQIDAMRNEMNELAERVDFTERMLAQQKDRDRLGKGGGA
jgi:TM2 domain-containing membrane protein YozV